LGGGAQVPDPELWKTWLWPQIKYPHIKSSGFSGGAGGALHRGLKIKVVLGASGCSPKFSNYL